MTNKSMWIYYDYNFWQLIFNCICLILIAQFDNICYSITLKYYKVLGVDVVLITWHQISKINSQELINALIH